MATFGGGGNPCKICSKTVYPAEAISFEKVIYHVECFKCSKCEKKKGPGDMSIYEDKLYCRNCFKSEGFAQKQKNVKWTQKTTSAPSAIASKFGGGGVKCVICDKTVYAAETVSYEKKAYHQECFKCSQCDKKVKPSDAASFEDVLYCKKCFASGGFSQKQRNIKWEPKAGGTSSAVASKFGGGGTPCEICQKAVYAAEALSFEKKLYHAACFCCSECNKKTKPSAANLFEGKLLCSKCFSDGGYRQKQVTATKSTTTASTSAKFSKFGGGGNKCKICDKTVYPAETLSFEKDFYHINCFTCTGCEKKLTNSTAEYTKVDGVVTAIFCKKCYTEKGLNRA